jgi:hypothetical protein
MSSTSQAITTRLARTLDAEVFFTADQAEAARSTLLIGLDGEFRDYHPAWHADDEPEPRSLSDPAEARCRPAPGEHHNADRPSP